MKELTWKRTTAFLLAALMMICTFGFGACVEAKAQTDATMGLTVPQNVQEENGFIHGMKSKAHMDIQYRQVKVEIHGNIGRMKIRLSGIDLFMNTALWVTLAITHSKYVPLMRLG